MALGVYGTSAITAITAQNTTGVRGILPVDPALLKAQILAVLEDIGADAVKIGMLGSADAARAVEEALLAYPAIALILDPVLVATSGAVLGDSGVAEAMKRYLFPRATLITPNIPEAATLLGSPIVNETDMVEAAIRLLEFGSSAVLLKGGHLGLAGASNDVLVQRVGGQTISSWIRGPRVETRNTHGTGCTLSAAIAAHLARGFTLLDAVVESKKYLTEALTRGAKFSIGQGPGPLGH